MPPLGQYRTLGEQPTTFAKSDPDLELWQERREQARRDRARYEPIWHLCQSFIANRQWVGWSRRDKRIVTEPNPQNRERHTANVLTARLMTNVGKLVADEMLPRLFFRSDDISGLDFQKQASKALEYCWYEELDAEEKIYEAAMRICTYGLGAIQARWDPIHGPIIAKEVPYQGGKPLLDPSQAREAVAASYQNGQPVDFRDVRGRCSWDVLGPFNILPPPGVEHERYFPWIIIERPVPIERIRAQFGSKADSISEQNLASTDTQGLFGQVGTISDDPSDLAQSSPGKLKNHAILSTGYELPSGKYPNGRTFIWTQDTSLEKRDALPYTLNGEAHIGVRFLKYTQIPGRFWPVGLVEPGIGPQRQRNRSRSQYIEMKDRMGLGRIYARPGSIHVGQLPGGKVAEVIEVRQGQDIPTETGTQPVLGGWMTQDVAMHDADLDKVMGQGEVSLGSAPGGVSAYSAMALLAEQDDKRIGPILRAIRNEIAWLVRYTINDIRTYWPPDKQIMLAGQDGTVDAFVFNSSKIPDSFLVKVGTGAPAPRNQAAEIQKIFDLADRSVSMGQPVGVKWLYDSLEAGRALPLPETPQQVQQEKAELENFLIAKGGTVDPTPLDDHAIHIGIHQQAAEDHILVPGADDVVRALMEHIAEHQQMQAQQSGGATAPGLQGPQGALGGQTPGGPTPPTPGAPPDSPISFSNQLSPRPGSVIAGPGQIGRRF